MLQPNTEYIWIGVNDILSEGNFVYESDKEPVKFTNWTANNPDNARGTEDCAHMLHYTATGWNDAPCTSPRRFLCEQTSF